ncbi:hypothetical protein GQ457_05G027720 [Hibiscus cannabinus]
MLRLWFDDLERLEGFEAKRKIKVWVLLQDVTLQVWSHDFFLSLGSRWGTVCKIDDDTLKLNRFDEAKMLIEVQKVSHIPERINVVLHGCNHVILLKTEKYEGGRRFIDGTSPYDAVVEEANDASVTGSYNHGYLNSMSIPEDTTCLHAVNFGSGNVEKSVSSGALLGVEKSNAGVDGLVNVPIISGGDSFVSKLVNGDGLITGEGARDGPSLGPDISNESRLHDVTIAMAQQARNGLKPSQKSTGYGNCTGGKESERYLEAIATMEVGQRMGVVFDATERVILNHLEELENEDSRLGKSEKLRAVSRIITSSKPTVVFIQESKLEVLKPRVKKRLVCGKLNEIVFAPSLGAAGGIMSLWDSESFCVERYETYTNPCSKGACQIIAQWFSHWGNNERYKELVEYVCRGDKDNNIGENIRKIKEATKAWVKEIRRAEGESIADLENKIAKLEDKALVNANQINLWVDIKELKYELWHRYVMEEREWLQNLRLKWFTNGDRNTNYNEVKTIPIKDLGFELPKLSEEATNRLDSPFTVEEVWAAICSTDGNRAPGLDGFNLNFYKKFWPQLKASVMEFFGKFYDGNLLDFSFNYSYITLIPKKSHPEDVEDFRSISLVASLYKILARVLSRRLAQCINEVVGEFQFAFTQGKQAIDCALIANKVIEDLKRRKREAMVFKANFKRAYDSINWKFLDLVLDQMGFSKRWREWILMCISTPSIAVLVNGRGAECIFTKNIRNWAICGSDSGNKEGSDTEFETVAKDLRINNSIVQEWADLIGCAYGSLPTTYLGIPLGYRRNMAELWNPMIVKLENCLQNWKGKCLSFGGHITLVKSILMSIPVYFLSIFRMPKKIQHSLWRKVVAAKYGLDPAAILPVGGILSKFSWIWKRSSVGSWALPVEGMVKFNVDAAVNGVVMLAGIRGILRDHTGKILMSFSKYIGFSDPTSAELIGILEACSSFAGSQWVGTMTLIIESDSELAINRINRTIPIPACFQELVSKCREFVQKYNWDIVFVFRESNAEAHCLAKSGLQNPLISAGGGS